MWVNWEGEWPKESPLPTPTKTPKPSKSKGSPSSSTPKPKTRATNTDESYKDKFAVPPLTPEEMERYDAWWAKYKGGAGTLDAKARSD